MRSVLEREKELEDAWIQRWTENRMKDSFIRCGNCGSYSLGWCFRHNKSVSPDDECPDFWNPRILKEKEVEEDE